MMMQHNNRLTVRVSNREKNAVDEQATAIPRSTGWKPNAKANHGVDNLDSADPTPPREAHTSNTARGATVTLDPSMVSGKGQHIVGVVYGFNERAEATKYGSTYIWSFRLERYQDGVRLSPVPVVMRGVSFSGFIREGDTVALDGSWQEGTVAHRKRVYNITTNTEVKATMFPLPQVIALAIFILFVVGMFIWGPGSSLTSFPRALPDEPEWPSTDAQSQAASTNTVAQCTITIINPVVALKSEPDNFSRDLIHVTPGPYHALDHRILRSLSGEEAWFQIEVDGRTGWILDNTWAIDAKTASCP
jgi:hypothetical protein